MALRKLSPGGYEYLTGAVACADRELEAGESLADYYFAHGYPPGEWFGQGARALGVSGLATQAQITALFGEGRHPNADAIEAAMIADGATPKAAMRATQLGNRFGRYGEWDDLRSATIAAYKEHNRAHGRLVGAPIDDATRATIRAQVHRSQFAKAHYGQPPASEKELNTWLAEQKKQLKTAVAGYEMVFAPPKSVSVAWALADEPTRDLIGGLHRQAVVDALTYFETNAAFTRHGNGGIAQVDVDGISAVLFEHWDSRTGDPHLHTHVPISTKVKRSLDGRWTALDGRTVFAATVTISEYYNSRLRDLFRDHGASWTEKPAEGIDAKRPVWELDGIPLALLEGFSRRSHQVETDRARRIVAFRHRHRREPNPKELLELGKQAQYASRLGKQPPRTLAEHVAIWREDARHLVGDTVLSTIGQRVFHTQPEARMEPNVDRLARATLETVEAYHSHFNRWNIEAEAHRQTAYLAVKPGERDRLITEITDTALSAEGTICLQPPVLVAEPPALRRRSGQSVFIPHNAARYTTSRTLRAEHDLLRHARQTGGHQVPGTDLDRALAGRTLNPGQLEMVRAFAQSGRRLHLALAPAGTGKTTAMQVLADAWRSSGGRVYAFAPSARAAQELGDTIGARPHTLHQLTTAQDVGIADRAFSFRNGDLVIIDEAAMAGTHTLHAVVSYALAAGADVRLVGDDHQLGAVEAGGAVKLIARDIGALRLDEVVRFRDPDQADASLKIRAGHASGLTYYLDHGRFQGGSRETMRDAAHRVWRADLDEGRHALLIVPTIDDVVALNHQARAQRIARGHVDASSSTPLHDGTLASVGDVIVTRHNNRYLTVPGGQDFVKNGDTWRVNTVHPDGRLTATHQATLATIELPADYVATHVELAYAATINRVQGMTSDTSHNVIPDTLTREQLYTAATRGRDTNHLYVITHHHVADEHRETPPERTAESVLTGILRHSELETSATETLRRALQSVDSLATLVTHHDHAARLGDSDRYHNLIARHAPEALHQPAEPALIQTLRNAHDLGWQPEHLLRNPHLTAGLDDGRDPAALLQWRIDTHITRRTPPPNAPPEPQPADVRRWQHLVTTLAPSATVTDPDWNRVWAAAADGKARGLNADAAVYDAAGRLANRTPDHHLPDPTYTTAVIQSAVNDQAERGHGHTPALPWLARIDFTTIDQHDGLRDYLRDINDAIATRTAELRNTAIRDQPEWTSRLGPRPADPEAAARWGHLVGIAAAYRDTYQITTTDPATPVGDQPDGHGLKARAWHHIINEWRNTMTNPDPDGRRAATQRATNALRDSTAELREDHRDLAVEHHDDQRHEDELRRRDRAGYDYYDEHYDESVEGRSSHSGLGY